MPLSGQKAAQLLGQPCRINHPILGRIFLIPGVDTWKVSAVKCPRPQLPERGPLRNSLGVHRNNREERGRIVRRARKRCLVEVPLRIDADKRTIQRAKPLEADTAVSQPESQRESPVGFVQSGNGIEEIREAPRIPAEQCAAESIWTPDFFTDQRLPQLNRVGPTGNDDAAIQANLKDSAKGSYGAGDVLVEVSKQVCVLRQVRQRRRGHRLKAVIEQRSPAVANDAAEERPWRNGAFKNRP